jgi:hypothetical protein
MKRINIETGHTKGARFRYLFFSQHFKSESSALGLINIGYILFFPLFLNF